MQHFSDTRHLAYSQYVADVSAYVSRLPGRDVSGEPEPPNAVRAARLYARQCARCHGDLGDGNEDQLTPRLAGQHRAYLVAQLEPSTLERRPPMQDAHRALIEKTPAQDIAAVAAWLAALSTGS